MPTPADLLITTWRRSPDRSGWHLGKGDPPDPGKTPVFEPQAGEERKPKYTLAEYYSDEEEEIIAEIMAHAKKLHKYTSDLWKLERLWQRLFFVKRRKKEA